MWGNAKDVSPAKPPASWQFHNPVEIFFGEGVRAQLEDHIPQGVGLALVSSERGRRRIEADVSFAYLYDNKDVIWIDEVEENPDVDDVQTQVDRLRLAKVQAIVAIGGGSVMDTAKAISVALGLAPSLSLRDLLSDPSLMSQVKPVALFTVPTTAGTGSEVTPFATLWDRAAKKKLSIVGKNTFPKAAIVDPLLTYGLPEAVTISTGLDAINQAAESIWNRNANPISMQIAMQAFRLGMEALPRLLRSADDAQARSAMAECSLLAGMAISHTRTALCHSISYPLTSHFGVPHGLACAFTMHAVFNLNARHDDGRMLALATSMGIDDLSTLGELVRCRMQEFGVHKRVLGLIPSFASLMDLQGEMFTPGRADNNLAPVDADVIRDILEMSYHAR
tara:strand:- start:1398 stop:2576 length:1179 start_codon:yes stop_codon:yes gene_type:complete